MKKIKDEDWPTTEQIKEAMPGFKVPTGAIDLGDGRVFHMNYILNDEGVPVPEDDHLLWMKWMEEHSDEMAVAKDYDEGHAGPEEERIHVSTVFLGRNLNLDPGSSGKPLVYETMIFGGEYDLTNMRYATREEALVGHQVICNAIMQLHPHKPE